MISRNLKLAFLLLMLVTAAASPYTHPRYGGRLRLRLPARPASLDPVSCRDGSDTAVFDLLYRRMFQYNTQGDLASVFFDAHQEADRWVFALHPSVASSGQPIGIEELKRCIERGLKQKNFPARFAARMLAGGVDYAEGRADTLAAFVPNGEAGFSLLTSGPQPLLPHILSRPPFYVCAETPGEFFGNAAFKLAGDPEDGALVLDPNPADPDGMPFVERVRLAWKGGGEEPVLARMGGTGASQGPMVETKLLREGGIPRTILLGLNPLKPPFSDIQVRRNFLASLSPSKFQLPEDRGTIKARCSYIPAPLGGFPAVTALSAEGALQLPAIRIMVVAGSEINSAVLSPAFPAGAEIEEVADDDFRARLAAGDYQAFLLIYEHRFWHPALDLMEMLSDTRVADAAMLDASNRLGEVATLDDRSATLETIVAAERSLAESGILFPLAEYSPAVMVETRIHGMHLDMRWNLVLDDCWVED